MTVWTGSVLGNIKCVSVERVKEAAETVRAILFVGDQQIQGPITVQAYKDKKYFVFLGRESHLNVSTSEYAYF